MSAISVCIILTRRSPERTAGSQMIQARYPLQQVAHLRVAVVFHRSSSNVVFVE
jgi:hypothetical protein